MTKHKFAWENLIFGLLFLAIAGSWIGHRQDAFTVDDLDVIAPIILITLGIIGIGITIWRKK